MYDGGDGQSPRRHGSLRKSSHHLCLLLHLLQCMMTVCFCCMNLCRRCRCCVFVCDETESLPQCIRISPGEALFPGIAAGQKRVITITVVNVSLKKQRIHITPPTVPVFTIISSPAIKVAYTAVDDDAYHDVLHIISQGEPDSSKTKWMPSRTVHLQLHAYPVVSQHPLLPANLHFGDESRTMTVNWSNSNKVVPFRYQFKFVDELSDFSIEPMTGEIPADGETNVYIKYAPTSHTTNTVNIVLSTDQFKFMPIKCVLTGSCPPKIPVVDAADTQSMSQVHLPKITHKVMKTKTIKRSNSMSNVSSAAQQMLEEKAKYMSVTSVSKLLMQTSKPQGGHEEKQNERSQRILKSVLSGPVKSAICDSSNEFGSWLYGAERTHANGATEPNITVTNSTPATLTFDEKALLLSRFVQWRDKYEKSKEIKWFVCLGEPVVTDEMASKVVSKRERYFKNLDQTRESESRNRLMARHIVEPATVMPLRIGDTDSWQLPMHPVNRTRVLPPKFDSVRPTFDILDGSDLLKRKEIRAKWQRAARTVVYRVRAANHLAKLKGVNAPDNTRPSSASTINAMFTSYRPRTPLNDLDMQIARDASGVSLNLTRDNTITVPLFVGDGMDEVTQKHDIVTQQVIEVNVKKAYSALEVPVANFDRVVVHQIGPTPSMHVPVSPFALNKGTDTSRNVINVQTHKVIDKSNDVIPLHFLKPSEASQTVAYRESDVAMLDPLIKRINTVCTTAPPHPKDHISPTASDWFTHSFTLTTVSAVSDNSPMSLTTQAASRSIRSDVVLPPLMSEADPEDVVIQGNVRLDPKLHPAIEKLAPKSELSKTRFKLTHAVTTDAVETFTKVNNAVIVERESYFKTLSDFKSKIRSSVRDPLYVK